MEPKDSLPHSKQFVTWSYPEPDRTSLCSVPSHSCKIPLVLSSHTHIVFPLHRLYLRSSSVPRTLCLICNMVTFLLWGVFSISPAPKLEDHPLSAFRNLSGGSSFCRKLRPRHAVVAGTHLFTEMTFWLVKYPCCWSLITWCAFVILAWGSSKECVVSMNTKLF